MCLFSCITLFSCSTVKEYKGTKINKLTYKTIDYMVGYTDIYELDFIDNKYSYIGYLPEDGKTPELNIKSTFTDDKV
jgi:hypothetical protein